MSYTIRSSKTKVQTKTKTAPTKTQTQTQTAASSSTSNRLGGNTSSYISTTPKKRELNSETDSHTESEGDSDSEDEGPNNSRESSKRRKTMSSLFKWQPSLAKEDGKYSCLHATYGSPWPADLNASASQGNSQAVTVAAFDIDGTLIKPRLSYDGKERTWPDAVDHTDYRELSFSKVSMFSRVRAEHEAGKVIVHFTNQNLRSDALETWKSKIKLISKDLNVPHHVFVAIKGDPNLFRKPRSGMWSQFYKMWNEKGGAKIEMQGERRSFFVGDAAGRKADPANGRQVKDHSDADKGFAENAGLKFFTPEEYCAQFVEIERRPLTKSISSSSNISAASTSCSTPTLSPQRRTPSLQSLKVPVPLFKPTSTPLVNYSAVQEIVLFVGVSGCGKSTLYEKVFKPAGYAWVNQDTLETRDKCLSAVTDEISKGGKVVVDNTNTSVEVRKSYIAIAQTHKIPIRCVQFHVDLEVCQQNNLFRSHQNPSRRATPSERIEEMYYALLEEPPTVSEGFQEIKRVNWRWEGSAEEKEIWESFANQS